MVNDFFAIGLGVFNLRSSALADIATCAAAEGYDGVFADHGEVREDSSKK